MLLPERVFQKVPTTELLKKYLLLKACSNSLMLRMAPYVMPGASTPSILGYPMKKIVYESFCGGESDAEVTRTLGELRRQGYRVILDYAAEGDDALEACWQNYMKSITLASNNPDNGSFDAVAIKLSSITSQGWLAKISKDIVKLSLPESLKVCDRPEILDRLDTIVDACKESRVKLYIDAEQIAIQPAIEVLCLLLMLRHNKAAIGNFVTVHGTYQMYLEGKHNDLMDHLQMIRKANCHFGAKIVRGAYLESDRRWRNEEAGAETKEGYPRICETITATHSQYNQVIDRLLISSKDESKASMSILLATHNAESVERALGRIAEGGEPLRNTFSFAQLYGMGEHLSLGLLERQMPVYKYLPYGPMPKVFPYLLRRLQENNAMVGNMATDLGHIYRELSRRTFG